MSTWRVRRIQVNVSHCFLLLGTNSFCQFVVDKFTHIFSINNDLTLFIVVHCGEGRIFEVWMDDV